MAATSDRAEDGSCELVESDQQCVWAKLGEWPSGRGACAAWPTDLSLASEAPQCSPRCALSDHVKSRQAATASAAELNLSQLEALLLFHEVLCAGSSIAELRACAVAAAPGNANLVKGLVCMTGAPAPVPEDDGPRLITDEADTGSFFENSKGTGDESGESEWSTLRPYHSASDAPEGQGMGFGAENM